MFWNKSKIQRNHMEDIENRRSLVRVSITRWAGMFYFGGSAALIAWLLFKGGDSYLTLAEKVYMATTPTCSLIIGYWFGNKKPTEPKENGNGDKGKT